MATQVASEALRHAISGSKPAAGGKILPLRGAPAGAPPVAGTFKSADGTTLACCS
jgi:hypothetical protein